MSHLLVNFNFKIFNTDVICVMVNVTIKATSMSASQLESEALPKTISSG